MKSFYELEAEFKSGLRVSAETHLVSVDALQEQYGPATRMIVNMPTARADENWHPMCWLVRELDAAIAERGYAPAWADSAAVVFWRKEALRAMTRGELAATRRRYAGGDLLLHADYRKSGDQRADALRGPRPMAYYPSTQQRWENRRDARIARAEAYAELVRATSVSIDGFCPILASLPTSWIDGWLPSSPARTMSILESYDVAALKAQSPKPKPSINSINPDSRFAALAALKVSI